MTADELAAKLVAGLRALAETIEANPHLADDLRYCWDAVNVPLQGQRRAPAAMAEWARAALNNGAKVTKGGNDKYFTTAISWGEVGIHVYAPRDEVCERVVTGVETVTKTVPDPVALAAVPQVEVTELVETVEWVCRPLLAAEAGTRVTS
jgi:hypothetical protein